MNLMIARPMRVTDRTHIHAPRQAFIISPPPVYSDPIHSLARLKGSSEWTSLASTVDRCKCIISVFIGLFAPELVPNIDPIPIAKLFEPPNGNCRPSTHCFPNLRRGDSTSVRTIPLTHDNRISCSKRHEDLSFARFEIPIAFVLLVSTLKQVCCLARKRFCQALREYGVGAWNATRFRSRCLVFHRSIRMYSYLQGKATREGFAQ